MDEDQRQQVAAELIAARQAKGWSAAELSRQTGLSKNTITRLDRGEVVEFSTITRVREALGVPPRIDIQREIGFPPNVQLCMDFVGVAMLRLPEAQWPEVLPELAAIFVRLASAERPTTGE